MKLRSKVLPFLFVLALAGCGKNDVEQVKSTTPPAPSSVEQPAEPAPEVTDPVEQEPTEFEEKSAYWTERIQEVYTFAGRAVTMPVDDTEVTYMYWEGDPFVRIARNGTSVDIYGQDGAMYIKATDEDIWYEITDYGWQNIAVGYVEILESLQNHTIDAGVTVTVVGHDDANNWDICNIDGVAVVIDCTTEKLVSVQMGDSVVRLHDITDIITSVNITDSNTLSGIEYADKCEEIMSRVLSDPADETTNYWTEHKDTLLPEDNFTIHTVTSTYSFDVTTFEGNVYARISDNEYALDVARVDDQLYIKPIDDFNWYKYDATFSELDMYFDGMREAIINGGEIVFVEHDDTRNYDICGNGGAVVTIDCATGYLVSIEDVSNSFIFEEADRLCEFDDFSRAIPLTDESIIEFATKLSDYLGGGL